MGPFCANIGVKASFEFGVDSLTSSSPDSDSNESLLNFSTPKGILGTYYIAFLSS